MAATSFVQARVKLSLPTSRPPISTANALSLKRLLLLLWLLSSSSTTWQWNDEYNELSVKYDRLADGNITDDVKQAGGELSVPTGRPISLRVVACCNPTWFMPPEFSRRAGKPVLRMRTFCTRVLTQIGACPDRSSVVAPPLADDCPTTFSSFELVFCESSSDMVSNFLQMPTLQATHNKKCLRLWPI